MMVTLEKENIHPKYLSVFRHTIAQQIHLEEQSEIEENTPVEFGKDGKTFYILGPYDDTSSIVEQLEEKVRKGNFDFTMGGQI